jgi:hypothetical protein
VVLVVGMEGLLMFDRVSVAPEPGQITESTSLVRDLQKPWSACVYEAPTS